MLALTKGLLGALTSQPVTFSFVKEEVYKRQAQHIDELEAYIRGFIEDIPREYIKALCLYVREQLKKMRRKGAGHWTYRILKSFEHICSVFKFIHCQLNNHI